MTPKLYNKNNNYIGDLTECSRAIVIEERNGMFELEIDYQLFSPHSDSLIRGNIIVADANDELKEQMFRIYKVTKNIYGRFTVYCRHISYDISRDRTEGLEVTNQSCEYCLNMLFRNSYFSQKFIGHSDIINAQNYNITATNLLTAIVGERGSIIDTFGTGAEILRDNYDFYVLNKRGKDNGVVIEYASNLTGLNYEEDEEGLITRIRAIAKYQDEEGNEQIISTYVTSDKVNNYETPFISEIDFSQKFEEETIPTIDRLTTLATNYFTNNKCDEIKYNYKVEFIPLSKCAGYEGIEDKIALCDTVRIIDYRYNLDTQAKVIKTTYDVLKERYESMELGEPKTSLGDIIGNNDSTKGEKGDKGDKGDKGEDGNIGDFPQSLPDTPILYGTVYGFGSIELNWSFENQVYYSYELYASKTKGFTPNSFDLIHEGQTSSYLFQANPNETWYFKCCGKNTYGDRTAFSNELVIETSKINDMSNYFTDVAIGNAVVGSLTADYMTAGIIKGHWIDAKNLSVTNGNGERTLDIDSNGDVHLNVNSLTINSSSVATQTYVSNQSSTTLNSANSYTDEVNQSTTNTLNQNINDALDSANANTDEKIAQTTQETDNKLIEYEKNMSTNIDNALQSNNDNMLNTINNLYARREEFESFQSTVSSQFTQTSEDMQMIFNEAIVASTTVNNNLEEYKAEVENYIRFSSDGMEMGVSDSPFKSVLSNEKLAFTQNNNEVAYISNDRMYITETEVLNNMILGNWVWTIGSNGNLTLKWRE